MGVERKMTRKEILEKTIDFDDAIHRIVRLEKENADLKKSCDETQELLDKQIEATYKLVEENAELKKENAELKEELRDANEKVVHLACNQNKDLKRKINKAKEIIKEFVEWANWQGNSKCPSFKSIQDKAEQFLKEVSE